MNVNTHGKQLLFSTVRVVNYRVAGGSVGTGFILNASRDPAVSSPVLVTNKHVVEGATTLELNFIRKDPTEDRPLLGQQSTIRIPNPAAMWTGHPQPDVDVAALPLAPILDQLPDPTFFRMLPSGLMPSLEVAEKLDAIEEVTFIGYPNGNFDSAHLTPIVRRGITATPLELPFGGRPMFLVDGSVFGGSSGSPVFLFNEGSYSDGSGGLILGSRLLLVGIIAQTMIRHGLHPIVVSAPQAHVAQELNLGVAFNWTAINETVDALFVAHGAVRPSAPAVSEPSA